MGRMLKNTVFKTGSYTLGVPSSISSIGPDVAQPGQTRYNTTTGKLEFYNNNVWNSVSKEGNVVITKDSFTAWANALQTTFTMTNGGPYLAGQEAQVLVFLNTVFQNPGINYTFSNVAPTTINFTSPAAANATIIVLHNIASTITS